MTLFTIRTSMRQVLSKKLMAAITLSSAFFLLKGLADVGGKYNVNLSLKSPYHKDSFTLTQTALRAKGPLAADDPLTITYLRKHYLEGPDDLPYDLREDWDRVYTRYKTIYPSWGFVNDVLKDLYAGRHAGVFVEAGALDGEYLSNTLHLERRLGWTGLLVEADMESYRALRRKHRRAWSSPACLGSRPYPYSAVLSTYRNQAQRASWAGRGAARLEEDPAASSTGSGYKTFQAVQCFPPLSFFLAINASAIDLFSLDVEGAEVAILEAFPFERVTVDVWVIEHVRQNATPSVIPPSGTSSPSTAWYEDPRLISFMERRGYYLLDVFCHPIPDYIFVRRGSEVFRRLAVPRELWRREGVCQRKGEWQSGATYNPRLHRDTRHWPRLEYSEGGAEGMEVLGSDEVRAW